MCVCVCVCARVRACVRACVGCVTEEGMSTNFGACASTTTRVEREMGAYRRKDDNRRLRVEIAIRAIASEFTIA